MGCSKGSSKKEVYSNTNLPKEKRKSLSKQIKLHQKQLEKEEEKKSQN